MNKYGVIIFLCTLACPISAQEILPLDGTWQIIYDEENIGRDQHWMSNEVFVQHPKVEDIYVPAAWERFRQDYEGVAFYRKSFEVPSTWEGKIVRLQFDAVNYLTEVWINDEVVGFHEGGFTPFEFRVDEMIKTGQTNSLTLRVVGPLILSDKEIDGVKKMETPQWRGGINGGIWQPVRLVVTGSSYVLDVFLQTNFQESNVTFHVEVDHTGIEMVDAQIELNIIGDRNQQPAANKTINWQLHPGLNKKSWTLQIPDAQRWSPQSPHLYKAMVKVLHTDHISDQWQERFGMRDLTIKNKDFYLNGERIFIKATFFEGLYPNGIAYPDSKEMIRREIQLAKDAGFNMIRPWRRPPAPIWLDLADEMGVLVVGSPALECMTLPLSTPYLPTRVENEVRQAILRDRNRACIVQWELFNELHRPVLKQLMRPMAMLARQLDPTRLILDESGGWAFGANMYLPGDFEPTKFNDIHNYAGPFINRDKFEGYLSIGMTDEEKAKHNYRSPTPGRNVVPGLMSYVSEMGYGSLPEMLSNIDQFETEGNPLTPAYRYHKRLHNGQIKILEESGFKDLYPDMRQFYLDQQQIHGAANKRMIEAVRSNPKVDGYCIHALCAGDWIMGAGLIDLWRNPKSYAYEGTKAANQPRIVSIRTFPRNVYAEQGMNLEITGINDLVETDAKIKVEIISPKGKIVKRETIAKHWTSGISTLLKMEISTLKWAGPYKLKVTVSDLQNELLTENQSDFHVFKTKELKTSRKPVALIDLQSSLATYLRDKKVPIVPFDSGTSIATPVLITSSISDNQEIGQIHGLHNFIKKGGRVVYLEGTGATNHLDSTTFPFTAKVHPAQGLWTCIPHIVRDHPLFSGLPHSGMMRNLYENVWPNKTLRNLRSLDGQNPDTVVASIGFDWFSRDHKMHYSGPGDAWWGSDMAIVPYGKGTCIISQLRITKFLGRDPVADKLLGNLLAFVHGL